MADTMKITADAKAGGMHVTVADAKGVHTSWTFATDAEAAKQRAQFAAELDKPEHAELAAKLDAASAAPADAE